MKINYSKIKKEMKRNGWNYNDLAKAMNISRQRLNFALGPKNKWVNFKTIDKIANALDVDSRDLLL